MKRLLAGLALLVSLAALSLFLGLGEAADHRDGPFFGPPGTTSANGRADINDVYAFQSPATPANTVLAVTISPFAGVLTPTTFDQGLFLDLHVDNNGDAVEDFTLRVNFGAPDAAGSQEVVLRSIPSSKFPPTGILARGKTNTNISVAGGGMFRAGYHDDPFFFDSPAFSALISGQNPPPPPGGIRNPGINAFGPNVNTLAIILEVPSTRLTSANSDIIGVWATTQRNGVQVDRMGRPAINTALIPPVPRNNLTRGDRRTAFNAGQPRNDVRDFKADMLSILKGFYGKDDATANAFTGLLLPDILMFQVGNPNGFGTFIGPGGSILGNGRRLRDAVIHTELNLLTGGAITTDNVNDDNGTRITDGQMGTVAAFPYFGPPNNPSGNPANFH
ncbi:MAG TPA: DUF4331 family protein [Gemmataceae bacterium]|jgi:hypothetical protein|nr:DUF4331 family protein [Gemmataceae bacterium]